MCKRFHLIRHQHDGVNDSGIAAEGVVFGTGKVALCWMGQPHSLQTFDSMADLMVVQNKNGITQVAWLDTAEPSKTRTYSPGAQRLRDSQAALRVMLTGGTVTLETPGSLTLDLHS